jgi:putative transcriptional regulator
MIVVNIDVMLAKRRMSVSELSEKVGFTKANVSLLKNGKIRALKMSTLDKLCRVLQCQPADLLEYVESDGSEYDD